MPRGIPNQPRKTNRRNVGQPRDLFKIGDIKEDALAASIVERAGMKGDNEAIGFVKSVIPRFADWSANQGIKSLSNMAKEFAKPGAVGGTGSNSAANNSSQRAQAVGQPRRGRPGRKAAAKTVEKGQARGTKRGPGRPRKDRPSA
jgi:hypothetical protein